LPNRPDFKKAEKKNDVLHLLPFNGLFSVSLLSVHTKMLQGVIVRALVSEYDVRKTEPYTQLCESFPDYFK